MTVVTLELPQRIYRKAERLARATKRPIEQIVVDWIQPPGELGDDLGEVALENLEALGNPQLIQIARSSAAPADSARLQALFELQERRGLTAVEHDEAAQLVEQEDRVTLRKAKALYLLKQRHALPGDLAALFA